MKHFIIINGLNVRHIEAENMADGITNAQNYSDHSKEVLIREIEPKITYYLFGDEAVTTYANEGIEAVIKEFEENELNYSTFKFIEGVTPSVEIMQAFQGGWDEYSIITKEEYDQL